MTPSAFLVNVARGALRRRGGARRRHGGRTHRRCRDRRHAEEPLPPPRRSGTCRNVLITPHTAGETRRYEDNVLDILQDNLERLWRGETTLRNQVV